MFSVYITPFFDIILQNLQKNYNFIFSKNVHDFGIRARGLRKNDTIIVKRIYKTSTFINLPNTEKPPRY